VVHRTLKDDGLFLLHTIGKLRHSPKTDAWIDKYIFPNGKLPSAKEIASGPGTALSDRGLAYFGPDYDRT